MDDMKKLQYQYTAKKMVDILNKKHYAAYYAETLLEAREKVLGQIPEGSSIALGGSETINAMGLIDTFRNGNYKLYDRYQKLPFVQRVEIMRQSLLADYLVTGTNAITKHGELVNIDCTGNRVAGMIFGPKHVIVVAGVNKVVDNIEDAMKRLKKIAPLNARRIKHDTPCMETGECIDCDIPSRLCNYITIINNGMKFEGRIRIILVPEEIGF